MDSRLDRYLDQQDSAYTAYLESSIETATLPTRPASLPTRFALSKRFSKLTRSTTSQRLSNGTSSWLIAARASHACSSGSG